MKVWSANAEMSTSRVIGGALMVLMVMLTPALSRSEDKAIVEVNKEILHGKATEPLTGGSAHVTILSKAPARYLEVPAYTSTDQKLSVVVKQYDKISLRLIDWPEDEFMYFLSGEVQITDTTGHATAYRRGDAIVIPKGFTGTWTQRSRISMYTVSYTAKR